MQHQVIHGNLFFTTWYGVYQPSSRTLRYASAGHPPAFLIQDTASRVHDLRTRNPPTGTTPEREVLAEEIQVQPGDRLYVFSDGAYEIRTHDGTEWQLADLRTVIMDLGQTNGDDPVQIYRRVCAASATDLEDDFAMVALRFN